MIIDRLFQYGAVLLLCTIGDLAGAQTIIPYNPSITGLTSSGKYVVAVNGRPIPVMTYSGKSYAWFAFSGPVTVSATYNPAPIVSYTLSPKRRSFSPVVTGRTLSFVLGDRAYVVLRNVNSDAEPLILLADPLEMNPPVAGGSGVINLSDYSPDPTGVRDSTAAFQRAINAAHARSSGGTVFVGPGFYRQLSTITVTSNVNLYLAPGAVLFAPLHPSQGNLSLIGDPPVLVLVEGTNAKVTGRGILYQHGTGSTSYIAAGELTTHGDNIAIDGIMILDSANTGLRLTGNYQTVNNVKILSGVPTTSADGMDFDNGTNFTVTNSFFLSTDDSFSVGYSYNAWNVYGATNTISVTGNLLWNTRSGAVMKIIPCKAIPSVSNVTFDNNDSISAETGIAIYPMGNVAIHDIAFRNSRIEEVRKNTFETLVTNGSGWGLGACVSAPAGNAYNIAVDGVTVDNAGGQQSLIYGASSSAAVNNVNFNNVSINGVRANDKTAANMYVGPYASNITFTSVLQGMRVGLASPASISVAPGKTITFTTVWTGGPTALNQMIFLHFVDANGNIAFQDPDHYPAVPSTSFSNGYTETRTVTVPNGVSGTYRMLVGLFDSSTGARLTLTPGQGVMDNGDQRYQIGNLSVQNGCVVP